jgi:hypothetical protein
VSGCDLSGLFRENHTTPNCCTYPHGNKNVEM